MKRFEVTAVVYRKDEDPDLRAGDTIILTDDDKIELVEVRQKFEAGWYADSLDITGSVTFYTEDELADILAYSGDSWAHNMTRVNPPTPYVEPPEEKYTDGYYQTYFGKKYRRLDGIWSYQDMYGEWQSSIHNDETIEDDTVYFVPIEGYI